MRLTADPAFVFIKEPTPSVECTVSWETFGNDFTLYRRERNQVPVLVDLTDSERRAEQIKVNVRPGDVFTYALYKAGKERPDPTFKDPPAEALASIYGLVETRADLITSFEIGSGGTYIDANVRLKETATVTLEVSDAEPFEDPITKMLTFPYFLAQDEKTLNAGRERPLEAKPLLAGNQYAVIIRAVDLKGKWQVEKASRSTKLRTVTGEVVEIVVDNCGDSENGEAQFWVEIGQSGRETDVGERLFFQSAGGDKFKVQTKQRIPLPPSQGDPKWTFTTGSRKIAGGLNNEVVVRTNGIEHDGILESHERASGIRALPFPTGSNDEKFADRLLTVEALPSVWPNGDPHQFRYTVRVRYSADYSD